MINKAECYNNFCTISDEYVNQFLAEDLEQYEIIKSINREFDSIEKALPRDRDTIDNTIGIILRIVLWDRLFKETEYIFDERRFWGRNKNKKSKVISYLIPIVCEPYGNKGYPVTAKELFSIFGRWPKMRDSFWGKQKDALQKCVSKEDYSAYIKKNYYLEFSLSAKYSLSRLNYTPYVDARTAIDLFPDSDILPIEELRSLFEEVNGIQFMWRGKASGLGEEALIIKELVTSFIACFIQVPHHNDEFVHTKPVDFSLLKGVLDCFIKDENLSPSVPLLRYEWYIHNSAEKNKNDVIVSSISFFNNFLSLLNSFVAGVSFVIPSASVVSNLKFSELEYTWATDDIDASKILIIRRGDDRSFCISENAYAGCFFMIKAHCDS